MNHVLEIMHCIVIQEQRIFPGNSMLFKPLAVISQHLIQVFRSISYM